MAEKSPPVDESSPPALLEANAEAPLTSPRWLAPASLCGWAAFCTWIVWGYPPCVDLPAHAAQIETLKSLLQGNTTVAAVYTWHARIGYGLIYWLGLPIAFLWNGAAAARALLWAALVFRPVGWMVLARTLGRSVGALPLVLPLAFGLSYWYGFLSSYLAESLLFFGLALLWRMLERPTAAGLVGLAVFGLILVQCHLLVFGVFLALGGCLVIARPDRYRAARLTVPSLVAPLLLCAPRIWTLAGRVAGPNVSPATEYDAMSHLNWFFKNQRAEGQLSVVYPVLAAAVFAAWRWRRRGLEPAAPLALFAGAAAVYLLLPKNLSGVHLVSVRLPALAAALSLLLVDWKALPLQLRALLVGLSVLSLGETASFHWRFDRAIAGLKAITASASPRANGYISTVGSRILGSRHIYLEHLGAWVTATRGGVGQNFLADGDQEPVAQRVPGEPPSDLARASQAELEGFETLAVFGSGPLPESVAGWTTIAQVNAWSLLARPSR